MQANDSDQIEPQRHGGALLIRAPQPCDGPEVWRLIEAAGALDTNSLYCNLLQCSHFAATCAVAEMDGEIVGWMSGHALPARPDALPDRLFVWQVCVADAARGRGLARKMIASVLRRPECRGLRHLECTITEANAASWALFRSVARSFDAVLQSQPHFLRETHLDDRHDSEIRVSIGPFGAMATRRATAA